MKRWLLIFLAILGITLAACRAPAGEPGSGSAEPSDAPAASSAPATASPAGSYDPYDY